MNLLVKKSLFFIDPHGSMDNGGVEKFVTQDLQYLELNEKYLQYGEIKEKKKLARAEDGYNAEAAYFEVKEISDEQYLEFGNIIKAFKDL